MKITIIENGPAIIETEDDKSSITYKVKDNEIKHESKKIAICRCGKSANGVTCDGSHKNETK